MAGVYSQANVDDVLAFDHAFFDDYGRRRIRLCLPKTGTKQNPYVRIVSEVVKHESRPSGSIIDRPDEPLRNAERIGAIGEGVERSRRNQRRGASLKRTPAYGLAACRRTLSNRPEQRLISGRMEPRDEPRQPCASDWLRHQNSL